VAFDIDGTLYPNVAMVWKSLPLFFANIPLIHGLNEVRKDIRHNPEKGDFHHIQARRLAKKLRISPEKAHALVESKVYTRWYRIFPKLSLYKGLVDTIESIRSWGLKTAVMSDFPIRNRLKDLGVGEGWDTVFSSEETGYLKPRCEPFLEIATRLQVLPKEVLYVGNSYGYDVIGAKGAGMLVAHLTKRNRSNSLADFNFSKYEDLKNYVEKLIQGQVPGRQT